MTIAIHVIIEYKIDKIAYQLKEGKIILCAMIQRLKIKPTLGENYGGVIIDTWKLEGLQMDNFTIELNSNTVYKACKWP